MSLFKLSAEEKAFIHRIALTARKDPKVVKEIFMAMGLSNLVDVYVEKPIHIPFLGKLEVACNKKVVRGKVRVSEHMNLESTPHFKASLNQLYSGKKTQSEKWLARSVEEALAKKVRAALKPKD